MKRLILCVSLTLLFLSLAFASEPVQLQPVNVGKSFQYPLKGQWYPNADPLYVGIENYTTLKNFRYSDTGLETVDGYSKITSTALGSGAYTILSGYQYNTSDGSRVLTKVNNSSTYQLYENRTAPPSQGDYLTTNPLNTTGYETIVLDANQGTYTHGPQGLMFYGDSTGVYSYGGGNVSAAGSVGIDPTVVFVSTDATVPLSDIFDYTDEATNSTDSFTLTSSQYLYIGTPYKVKWFYFTVSSANVSTSTMSMTCWEGSSWASETVNDYTSSGGITLAQTGSVYTQQTNSPVASYLNGDVLYWYRFSISAGSAGISNIQLQTPLQPVADFWNGSGRTCIKLVVYRNSENYDYTYQVAQTSTIDAPYTALLGGLGASDFVYMMFEEPIMGIDLKLLGNFFSNNYSAANIDDIEFWDGDSYVSVSGLRDETDLNGAGGSLQLDGAVTWSTTSTYLPEKVQKFGVYGYLYRMSFDGLLTDTEHSTTNTNISFSGSDVTQTDLGTNFSVYGKPGDLLYISNSTSNDGIQTIESFNDDTITVTGSFATESAGASITLRLFRFEEHEGTSIDTVSGITAPINMSGYSGVGYYSGRVMLIDGNKVDYSLPNYGWVFNGVNTSNEGAPNPAPLYFGDNKDITATHSLSNRYGSNIIQSWVVTKKDETYSLTGSQPYADYNEPFIIRKMSSTVGCPASMTMKEVQISLEDIQRNALMWLDATGPVIFDGAVISSIKGIENYFDPSKDEYIKTSIIEKATAYYDSTHHEYNLLFPSGSSATANNVWLVYDLKKQRWYEKEPASYPIYTITVKDTDGVKYNYGHLSSGHLMRLDHNEDWDGTFIDQQITTGLFSPPMVDDLGFWSRSKIRGLRLLPGNNASDAVLLLHMNGSDASTTFTDNAGHTMAAQSDAQLDTAAYKYGTASGLFDGTDDYVSTADSSDWDISTDFTIDGWVKHTDYTGTETYVSQKENGTNYWQFGHFPTYNGLFFTLINTGGTQTVSVESAAGNAITDSDWHHVAMIKVGYDYGLYLDGTQVGYTNDSSMTTFAGSLTIGSSGAANYFDGHLDDIRIYKRNIFHAQPNSGRTDTITVPDSGIFGYATVSLYHDGSLSSQNQLVALDEDGVVSSDLYGGHNFSESGNFFQVDISATTTYDKFNPLIFGYKSRLVKEEW